MGIRDGMKKSFTLLILLIFLFPLNANGSSERFCIQKIQAPNNIVGIDKIYEFQKSPHTIYLLGNKANSFPALLEGNEFKKLSFPSRIQNFIDLPNGTILATGKNYINTPALFFKLEKDSKHFEEIKVEGPESLLRLSPRAWSTPLGGVFLVQGGTLGLHGAKKELPNLFLLKGNKARKLEVSEGHIQRIIDFPELNITFLGSHEKDGIYIIDANKTVHSLGELNLGRWIHFQDVFHLKNPNRLLVKMSETMGPYQGFFLIQLVNSEGVWKPALKQNFTNIFQIFTRPNKKYQQPANNGKYISELGEYVFYGPNYEGVLGYYLGIFPRAPVEVGLKLYRVGAENFEEIVTPSEALVSNLPNYLLKPIGLPINPSKTFDYRRMILDMPASNVKVIFTKSDIQIRNEDGEELKIKNNPIEGNTYYIKKNYRYLDDQKAVFINTSNGYFLLKDKKISGESTCDD